MATTTPRLGLPVPEGHENFNRAAYTEMLNAVDTSAASAQELEEHENNGAKHTTLKEDVLYADLPATYSEGLTLSKLVADTANAAYTSWRDALYSKFGLTSTSTPILIVVETFRSNNTTTTVQQKITAYNNTGDDIGKLVFTASRTSHSGVWGDLQVTLPALAGAGNPEGAVRSWLGATYFDQTERKTYTRSGNTTAFTNTGWVAQTAAIDTKLDTHIKDDLGHTRYIGSTNGGNAWVGVSNNIIWAVGTNPLRPVTGSGYKLIVQVANTGNVTLSLKNVDGTQVSNAYPVLTTDGKQLTSGAVTGGAMVTVVFSGSAFFLQGKGGGYGTSDEIPIDRLWAGVPSNSFGNLPFIFNYSNVLNNIANSPTLVRYNHVDKVLHLAVGMGYKAYEGQALKWQTNTTNGNGYTHSLDAENRILYISLADGKISKRSSNNIAAQYWETTDTGMDGPNSVTHIPGDQGFMGFNGTTGLRFSTNGNKLWTLTSNTVKGTITAICATQANEIFVVAYEYTGSYVSTLYKINGATGAVTTTTLTGFQSAELVKFIRVDEVNQKLALLGANGSMQMRAISDPSTMFNAIGVGYTNETKGMGIDSQGRIYVVHNSGPNGFGLTKFTSQLGVMWHCKLHTTSGFTSFMLGLDIDRTPNTPNTPYPELYLATTQGSGVSGSVLRNKQTYTITT